MPLPVLRLSPGPVVRGFALPPLTLGALDIACGFPPGWLPPRRPRPRLVRRPRGPSLSWLRGWDRDLS